MFNSLTRGVYHGQRRWSCGVVAFLFSLKKIAAATGCPYSCVTGKASIAESHQSPASGHCEL